MHLVFIRSAIFLLFILTRKFTVAYVKNVTHQEITPAKVLTKFLKVPWINLNSPWQDEVASTCRDDITKLFESADAGEMWALQMLDAASKIPSGILTGNIRDLGMYEECISVKARNNPANIQGRHCMVSLSMPPKYVRDAAPILYIQKLSAYNPTPDVALNFASSLCLPASCGVGDITGFVNASIQATPELSEFEVAVAQVTCSSVEAVEYNFTLGTILTISFVAVVAIFMVFCTACDFVLKKTSDNASLTLKTLAKFSLYTNVIKLASTKIHPSSLPAVNGIKFLSSCFVVTVHRFLGTLVKPLVNLSDIHELRKWWMAPFILLLPYAVDTFFIISGFLIAYFFMKKVRSGTTFNILQFYYHRYLRLTPVLAFLLLFDIFLLPYFGSGPIWETVLGVTSGFCRKNWWTNLLYVQNFVNNQEMCMPHTWYLAVEMQLYWLCPIILYPLLHRPKLGLVILSVLSIASLITPAIHLVANDYSFLFNGNKIFAKQYEEFINSYSLTYNRALPFFVGIFLGYYLVNNKIRLTKMQATVNWILACLFMVFCYCNAFFIQPNAVVYNVAWEATYVSIGRLGWSLAVSWIICACTQGYGGPVTSFLSLPMFVPLSRLCYGIYLVSAMLQVGINATEKTAEFNSSLGMIYLVWGDLATCIAAAFILNLFFETPVVVLEKILTAKQPSEITKLPPPGKKEKLLAIIKQYPDLTNGRTGSDSVTQARMLQPDFWRTVSDVLNTSLGKRPTKTPTEWVKTWQDWKSGLLKNNAESKTCANGMQNGSAQLETEIFTSEKELLIFLAAVSYGLDDVDSLDKSKIAASAGSQFVSCGSQNEDFVRLPRFDSTPFTDMSR